MKTKHPNAYTGIACATVLASGLIVGQAGANSTPAEWTTVVGQIQVSSGVEYYQVVPAKGTGAAFLPVEDGGAVFELWGLASSAGTPAEMIPGVSTGKNNNGHGNNIDGVDVSNPGKGKGGPTGIKNAGLDPSGTFDDEKKGGGQGTVVQDSIYIPGADGVDLGILFDSKVVDAYMPASAIRIMTNDPYEVTPRTRVDQPFRVEIDVANLIPGAEIQAAREVLFTHIGETYSQSVFTVANRTGMSSIYNGAITNNGTLTLNFPMTNLPGADPAKITGIEVFRVYALPDAHNPTNTQIAAADLQVFPLTTMEVEGINSGVTYKNLPTVTVNYFDLYPDSTTWIQIYQGSPALNTEGTLVPGSSVIIQDVTSHNVTSVIDSLGQVVNSPGEWTIEALTQTPFGLERLNHISFNYDNTIEVNGNVISSE